MSSSRSPSPSLCASSPSFPTPDSPDLPLSASRSLGKRRRDTSPAPSAALFEDDGKEKTRRVNPYRLAERLGPELVADLEAFIYPGARMVSRISVDRKSATQVIKPSYADRKVVQDKYSVDRRHIYDYLHSRGLRVAKEDRHLNLHRNRMQQGPRPPSKKPKPLPPARPRSPKTKKVKKTPVRACTPELKPCLDIQQQPLDIDVKSASLEFSTKLDQEKKKNVSQPSISEIEDSKDDYYEIEHLRPDQIVTFDPISIKERFSWEPKTPPKQDELLSTVEESIADEYSLDATLADELLSSWLDLDSLTGEPATVQPSSSFIQESESSQIYDLINSSLGSTLQDSTGSYMPPITHPSLEYQKPLITRPRETSALSSPVSTLGHLPPRQDQQVPMHPLIEKIVTEKENNAENVMVSQPATLMYHSVSSSSYSSEPFPKYAGLIPTYHSCPTSQVSQGISKGAYYYMVPSASQSFTHSTASQRTVLNSHNFLPCRMRTASAGGGF